MLLHVAKTRPLYRDSNPRKLAEIALYLQAGGTDVKELGRACELMSGNGPRMCKGAIFALGWAAEAIETGDPEAVTDANRAIDWYYGKEKR